MFTIASRAIGAVEPFCYLPGDEGLVPGAAAALTGGKLTAATATTRPTHILIGPARPDGLYPAMPVLPTTVFETKANATVADTLVGSAVTLNEAGDGVTATTASGVFRILATDGQDGGGTVRGSFI